jgi:ABC-type multidrug transport system permease subunit
VVSKAQLVFTSSGFPIIFFFLSFSSAFGLAASLTAVGVVTARLNGSWNRLLSVGVDAEFFVISQLISSSCLMIVQAVELSAAVSFFYWSQMNFETFIGTFTLFLLTGFLGLAFGLLCSVVLKTVLASFMASQITVYPIIFISGEFCQSQLRVAT